MLTKLTPPLLAGAAAKDTITPAAPSGWVLTGGGGAEGSNTHKRGSVSAEKYVGYSYS